MSCSFLVLFQKAPPKTKVFVISLCCFQSHCQGQNIQNKVLFELTFSSYSPAKVARVFIFVIITYPRIGFLVHFYLIISHLWQSIGLEGRSLHQLLDLSIIHKNRHIVSSSVSNISQPIKQLTSNDKVPSHSKSYCNYSLSV